MVELPDRCQHRYGPALGCESRQRQGYEQENKSIFSDGGERSLPRAPTRRERRGEPESVPAAAAAAPRMAAGAKIVGSHAAPLTAPLTTRAANAGGEVRSGMMGSLSAISLPSASAVRTTGVRRSPKN